MKKLIFALILLPLGTFAQQKKYNLTGHIAGAKDGVKVYLKSEGTIKKPINDSAVLKKGRFVFKGSLQAPVLVKLIIDRTPEGEKSGPATWAASNFYLENSNITYSGMIDSLPGYYYRKNTTSVPPVIVGSASQEEFERFSEGIKEVRKELSEVNDSYLKNYHIPAMEGKFNTKKGIDLANRFDDLSDQIIAYTFNYIRSRPYSIVSFDQASYMLAGYTTTLTIPQIEELEKIIGNSWQNSFNLDSFRSAAENARKTAIGIRYQDFEFLDADGNTVKLSQFVPEGKVVMLEFWASWCGPCRGEIPHLKHLHETKSDEFSIISISLDENEAAWKKAMKEEGMVWTQLVDYKGFEGEIAKAYNIFGIPHSLMLDEKGRIMKVGLRGAFIDAYIEKIASEKK